MNFDFHLFGWRDESKVTPEQKQKELGSIIPPININLPDINLPPFPAFPEYPDWGDLPLDDDVGKEDRDLWDWTITENYGDTINNYYAGLTKHDHSADTLSAGGKLNITTTNFGSGILKMVYDTDGYYPEVS